MGYRCILFICVLLLGLLPSLLVAIELPTKRTLNLATTEYPPFYSRHLLNYGVVPDICTQVFERMGYRVNVKSYPFARALQLMQEGKVDGFLGLWYRESRLSWANYSKPLQSHKIRLYKRVEDEIVFDGLSSLNAHLIGIGRAYANPKSFVEANLQTEAASSDEINLRKLFYGRIDLALISQDVAEYLINTGPGPYRGMFEPLGEALGVERFHFAAAKEVSDHQTLVNDFNLGLALLAQEGRLAQIFTTHGFSQRRIPAQE